MVEIPVTITVTAVPAVSHAAPAPAAVRGRRRHELRVIHLRVVIPARRVPPPAAAPPALALVAPGHHVLQVEAAPRHPRELVVVVAALATGGSHEVEVVGHGHLVRAACQLQVAGLALLALLLLAGLFAWIRVLPRSAGGVTRGCLMGTWGGGRILTEFPLCDPVLDPSPLVELGDV